MKRKLDFTRAAYFFSIPLVACNVFMIFAGTWSLAVPSGRDFDVFLDLMITAITLFNWFFVIFAHVFLNHRRNKEASRLQFHFSAYLVGFGLLVIVNILFTLVIMTGLPSESTIFILFFLIAAGLNGLVHLCPIAAGIRMFKLLRGNNQVANSESTEVVWSAKPVRADPSWEFKPTFTKFIKCVGVACIGIVFVLSIIVPSIFFTGGSDWPSFIAGDLAVTLFLTIVPCTLMLVRHVPRARGKLNKTLTVTIILAGGILACINALPLFETRVTADSLDTQFAAAYGPNWRSTAGTGTYSPFRSSPILIKDALYTIPLAQVEQMTDILYMVDKGQPLRFDWYAPEGITSTSTMLPLVIAIHAGSWRLFDKGVTNIIPTSKYIASLGYVVVDVQYGLFDQDDSAPFTFKDMIMEIANLTRFLGMNAASYHVDVSKTYFLGRSAGAHLALVCGLGHENPYFAGNYTGGFNCVGIIPFYPPTNLPRLFDTSNTTIFGVPSTQYSYFNPVDLVSATSPPVLCFQGLADTLVPPEQAEQLQATMKSVGRTCILGEFPYEGHAFDTFPNYPCNQVCLYYIERFLALTD